MEYRVFRYRYEIKIYFIGYKYVTFYNIVVTSRKAVILDILMRENLRMLNEVVVKASSKANAVNHLASISARSFSMEEVNPYTPKNQNHDSQTACLRSRCIPVICM